MDIALICGLFVVGILMVLAEVFLPGGVVGTVGGVLLILGVVVTFVTQGPVAGLLATVGVVVFGVLAFWAWIRFFPETKIGKKMFLDETAAGWHGYQETNEQLLGQKGLSHTRLHPSGIAMIGAQRVGVVTQGEMLEKGVPVKVIQVEGNRVVVALDEAADMDPVIVND